MIILVKKQLFFYALSKRFYICLSTELFGKEGLSDFESRNVELINCSTDSEQSHWGWLQVEKIKVE